MSSHLTCPWLALLASLDPLPKSLLCRFLFCTVSFVSRVFCVTLILVCDMVVREPFCPVLTTLCLNFSFFCFWLAERSAPWSFVARCHDVRQNSSESLISVDSCVCVENKFSFISTGRDPLFLQTPQFSNYHRKLKTVQFLHKLGCSLCTKNLVTGALNLHELSLSLFYLNLGCMKTVLLCKNLKDRLLAVFMIFTFCWLRWQDASG